MESHHPSIGEQRRFWDWHWEHWQERRTVNAWKDKRHDLILTCANRFVMDRLGEGEFPPQPPAHITWCRSAQEWKRLLRRHFEVLRIQSILPVVGHRGILRLTNWPRLNAALAMLIGEERVRALKEWSGLGYTLIVLARKVR